MTTQPAPMAAPTAAAVIAAAPKGSLSLDGDTSKYIIKAYLRATGLSPDAWGNYVLPDGAHRYHFASRVLNYQFRGSDRRWSNVGPGSSYPDKALVLLVQAARAVGDEALLAKVREKRQGRKEAKLKREAKATEDAHKKAAEIAAAKQVCREFPEAIREQVRGHRIDDALAATINERLRRLRQSHLDTLRQGMTLPTDQAIVEGGPLPMLTLLMRDAGYRYIVEQDGVRYTVTLISKARGQLEVNIGGAGALVIDPYAHGVRMDLEREGDGDLSASITVTSDGNFLAKVFAVGAQEKRLGAGTRLFKIWINMLKSVGIRWFIGERIGLEGALFLKGLCDKGLFSFASSGPGPRDSIFILPAQEPARV